jgi:activator of HSP90 ATPase
MRNVIFKSVAMPATAEDLFNTYMDPSEHAAITGAPVLIGDKSGSAFQAFDGRLQGTILQVVRPRLIVQSWRSFAFKAEDPDSTLILCFTPEGDQGRIDLIHLDVPDHDVDKVTQGWEPRYFVPWRKYLESR